MKLCIVYAIFCMFFISCKQMDENRYTNFQYSSSLSSSTINVDSLYLRYPFRIKHRDSIALILDLHHPEYFYHLFSYPEFKHKYSFGRRGEAPTDILSAENFRFLSDEGMYGLDANKHLLTNVSFENDSETVLNKEIALDKDIIRALDFVVYNDSCFIIPDYSGKYRFHFVDSYGKIKKSYGKIPSSKHKNGNIALAQAWRSFIDYNPNNQILAMVTQLGEVLEIYNLKDNTHTVKIGPHGEPEFKTGNEMAIPSGIMGFSDIQVTDKYIYAVFHGRSFKEIAKQSPNAMDGGKFIYVFSITGEPMYKYTLDHHIYGIDVNEETKSIYAVDVNSNNPIIKYKIEHL